MCRANGRRPVDGRLLRRLDRPRDPVDAEFQDWSALKQNFKENIYYPTALQWQGVNVSNVGIRSRGLGSRSGTKPGLRVDIDRYNVDQTFLGLKSFVLDNLVQDPSMLRERLTMAFFRASACRRRREATRGSS